MSITTVTGTTVPTVTKHETPRRIAGLAVSRTFVEQMPVGPVTFYEYDLTAEQTKAMDALEELCAEGVSTRDAVMLLRTDPTYALTMDAGMVDFFLDGHPLTMTKVERQAYRDARKVAKEDAHRHATAMAELQHHDNLRAMALVGGADRTRAFAHEFPCDWCFVTHLVSALTYVEHYDHWVCADCTTTENAPTV